MLTVYILSIMYSLLRLSFIIPKYLFSFHSSLLTLAQCSLSFLLFSLRHHHLFFRLHLYVCHSASSFSCTVPFSPSFPVLPHRQSPFTIHVSPHRLFSPLPHRRAPSRHADEQGHNAAGGAWWRSGGLTAVPVPCTWPSASPNQAFVTHQRPSRLQEKVEPVCFTQSLGGLRYVYVMFVVTPGYGKTECFVLRH